MELYRIQKSKEDSNLWKEKNTIEINEDFQNIIYKSMQDFTTSVEIEEGKFINLGDLIKILASTRQLDRKTKNELIEYAHTVVSNAEVFKRENALEAYRKLRAAIRPSRLHSVHLTDENGIEYWAHKLGNEEIELFRVSVEGNIFKTSPLLLPDKTLSYEKTIEQAYSYWYPEFSKIPNDANEYLVQGKIKVLEKIR